MTAPAQFQSNRGGYYMPPENNHARETDESSENTEEKVSESAERTYTLSNENARRAERSVAQLERLDTTPYTYGAPSPVPRESNYISEDNLLAWLSEKQNGLYADLRERMDVSRQRSKLMEDLSFVQSRIETDDITAQEAYDELTAMQAAYQGTPFEQEFNELFGPMLAELETALSFPDVLFLRDAMTENELETISSQIKNKVDALGRDDQLELIQINSLSSAINQAAQLASNLLSSSNQTENAIIGNIGR